MSPEDRTAVAASLANLSTAYTSLLVQFTRVLREENVLSDAAIDRLLQRLDADVDLLAGADDQAHGTEALAVVRRLLDEHGLRGGAGTAPAPD